MSDNEGRESLAAFIERTGITIDVEPTSENPNMADPSWEANHYLCTLHRGDAELKVPFSMGVGIDRGPTVGDVLESLASDASGAENASSFEDWAGEYGYDTDSRKAERTFKAVMGQTDELRDFLDNEFAALLWNTDRD